MTRYMYSAILDILQVSTGEYKTQVFTVPAGDPLTDKNKLANITFSTWTRFAQKIQYLNDATYFRSQKNTTIQ